MIGIFDDPLKVIGQVISDKTSTANIGIDEYIDVAGVANVTYSLNVVLLSLTVGLKFI